MLRALTPCCAPLSCHNVATALHAKGVRPFGEDLDERRATLRGALDSLCSRWALRRTVDKAYERVGGASATPRPRGEEVEAEKEADAKDGGVGGEEENGLLPRPLSAAAAAHLAKRIAKCATLNAKQRDVVLFALQTTNADASARGHAARGHSPLDSHAWNGATLANAWNKAHPKDEQLKSKYARDSLHAAVVSSLFLSSGVNNRKLAFPNPRDVGGAAAESWVVVDDGDEAMEVTRRRKKCLRCFRRRCRPPQLRPSRRASNPTRCCSRRSAACCRSRCAPQTPTHRRSTSPRP